MSDTFTRDTELPALAVRKRDSGAKSFIVFTTRPGRKGTHKITLGPVKKFTIAEARKQARIIIGQRAQGADVIATRQQAREAAKLAAKRQGADVGPVAERKRRI
jgi:hypothetical protein